MFKPKSVFERKTNRFVLCVVSLFAIPLIFFFNYPVDHPNTTVPQWLQQNGFCLMDHPIGSVQSLQCKRNLKTIAEERPHWSENNCVVS